MLPGIIQALTAIASIASEAPKLAEKFGAAFDMASAVIQPIANYAGLIRKAHAERRDITPEELQSVRDASQAALDRYLQTETETEAKPA